MILGLRFRDLKVRQKLMLLHNIFFAALAGSVYFAVVPFLEGALPQHAERMKVALVLALFVIYVLAVLTLELIILPRYVYWPIKLMLDADHASQMGDFEHEYIDDAAISGDELGRIMKSRNETVRRLRKNEAELVQKNELLERQDRLASLGLLSTSVAHELNTPLAVLQGSIEKLQETIVDPVAQERLSRMLRVTERLRKISEGLTDFARMRKDEKSPVALREVIEQAWGMVAIDEKAGAVRFANRVGEDVRVIGDAGRLVQVFVNLLRNALNAVSAGGNVSVDARLTPSTVCISVEDDGPGIPAGILPNIFEAFVSTRLDSRGTGLGLTVAEGIISQHGGSIAASNRPNGGARLEVKLPSAQ